MSTEPYFFSYARDDGAFALKLARDLREAGADVWIDQLDIAAGERWDSVVEQALKESAKMIVILSPDSVQSNNVLDEVSYALEEGKKVVPVIYRTCEVPFRLRRLQHISFTGDYDKALAELLDDLSVVPLPPPPLPPQAVDPPASPGDEEPIVAAKDVARDEQRKQPRFLASKRVWIIPVLVLAVMAGVYFLSMIDGGAVRRVGGGSTEASNFRFVPASPAQLRHGEEVTIKFDYTTTEPGGVRIIVHPFTKGSPTPNAQISDSPLYPPDGKRGAGVFTVLGPDEMVVDQVLVEIVDDKDQVVDDYFISATYTFVPGEGAVSPERARNEDCQSFNPDRVYIEPDGRNWRVTDGAIPLSLSDNRAEADRALETIRHYRMDRQCFVGAPDRPSVEYWLVGSRPPEGAMRGEECIDFDPNRLQVRNDDGGWLMIEGRRGILGFPSQEEAEQALAIINKHGLTHTCFIGSPDPSMTYFRR